MITPYLNELKTAEQAVTIAVTALRQNTPGSVRDLRRRLGWSQRELADYLKLHHTYISQIENGHAQPGRETLERLAELELREI